MENGIKIFTDGGALGNPGPAASAFVVYQEGKIVHKFFEKIGSTTNNVAEYQAVIFALDWLKSQLQITNYKLSVSFFLDSELVVRQLNGIYKIKNVKLQQLVLRVKSLERECPLKISYTHIPRTKNALADSLVKKALCV